MSGCGGDCSLLTIETKTACDISSITFYGNEKESLLAPGTQLKVKSCKKNGKVAEILLEEVWKWDGGGAREEGREEMKRGRKEKTARKRRWREKVRRGFEFLPKLGNA